MKMPMPRHLPSSGSTARSSAVTPSRCPSHSVRTTGAEAAGAGAPEVAVEAGVEGTAEVAGASGAGAGEAGAAAGTVTGAGEGAEAPEERDARETGGAPTPTVETPTLHGGIPAIG